MIYGYIRVSSDRQTVENQRFEIAKWAQGAGVVIDEWIEETISAVKKLETRKFGKLLGKLKAGDTVIATELSRFGRNLMQIMGILNFCMLNGVKVLTTKEHYELGDNINSKILAFAFGLTAELERTLISQRTKEALARIKSEGKKLGRPRKESSQMAKLKRNKNKILRLLKKGASKNKIAKIFKVHRFTLHNFLKEK